MDFHLVVKYAVHHSKAVLAPSFFNVGQLRQLSKEVTLLVRSMLPVT